MARYTEPENQLIVELYVKNANESKEFYRNLGFQISRDEGWFVELKWEDSRIFLEETSNASPPEFPTGNIRIVVPNVDDYWILANKLGVRVIKPIGDREYGLRDFTIAGPDGL